MDNMDCYKLKKGYRLYCTEENRQAAIWLIENNQWEKQPPFHLSRHSMVFKVEHPKAGELFVKSFNPTGFLTVMKDSMRSSRAYRAWKAGNMLENSGFHAPSVMAIIEKRRFGLLVGSFSVTLPLEATPLPDLFLPVSDFKEKRDIVRTLGREIGRMHRLGIVHGDLIPGNIFVAKEGKRLRVSLLDNESTGKIDAIKTGDIIKNLVQLNRFILPRITATDRIRFFDAYLKENDSLGAFRDELLRKVGEVTFERVARHRGIEKSKTTFRALMAWKEK